VPYDGCRAAPYEVPVLATPNSGTSNVAESARDGTRVRRRDAAVADAEPVAPDEIPF
jgi:hypothetical protein